MVNVNNNFNVIPWYSSLEQQNHRKWYAFDKQWPLIMPNTRFLPFQFVLETTPTNISAITVYSEDKSITRNLGIAPIAVPNAEKGYCVVMLHPEICDFTAALPEGRYYATLTIDGETLYSEVFTVVGNISSYLKLTYWNTDTLYYKNGEINYANDFRYEMYLDTTIGKPEYEFSEELTTRLGYKFLESQISNKLYKFIFLGPEFICDAMRLIRLSDYIKLESGRDSYNAISFSYEPSWETQGDLASIEVSFETDTIIQKLPSFNRNQRENFYNALLSSASEPLLYDEGVVAQYYTAFSDAITGKLTRQLAEANVEEITKSTMIPIDQGLGAAQRVSLLALFERYGGSENAYVSELQTTVSNHVSNQDIHLAAGEREKLTTLLSMFYFDKENNAVRTTYNMIVDQALSFGGAGTGSSSGGVTSLYALREVKSDIANSVKDGDVLTWDSNLGLWVNKEVTSGLDEQSLASYLTRNKYVTQEYVNTALKSYATTDGLTGVSNRVKTLEDVIGIDANGDVYIKKNGTAARNLYTYGAISFGGLGESTGGGGGLTQVTIKLGATEYKSENGVVSLPAYPSKVSDLNNDVKYATQSWVTDTALAGYATRDWVLDRGYATTSDLDTRINNLINGAPAAYDTLKEIADVLAGNVNSIGDILTALENKANKATTLSGYGITDALSSTTKYALGDAIGGNAANANKFGNQLPAYYATADGLTGVSNRVKTLEDVIGIDANGDVYIKKNGTVARNFYTYGAISFGGVGTGSGGGAGATMLSALTDVAISNPANGQSLVFNGTKWVNKVAGLDSTALWNLLGSSGSELIDSSHIPDLSGKYLSVSGGIVNNSFTVNASNNAYIEIWLNRTQKALVGWQSAHGVRLYNYASASYLSIKDDGTPTYNGNTLIHSGNIGSQSVDKATKIVNSDGVVMAQGDVYGLAISGSSSKAKYLLLSRASKNDGGIIFQEAGDNKWQIVDSGGALTFYNYTTRKSEVYMAASGNILLGTKSDSAAKLRIQTNRADTFTWALGSLASKSDMALEFYQDSSNIYGLYTAINYSSGNVAMQVGRSDGGTSAYNLILNPLGGNVLIGTTTNISWADLNVNGPIATKDYVSFYRNGEKGYVGCGAESTNDVYLSASTNNLRLYSKGFTAIRGGNVLIGKETESSYGYKLDIYQDADKDYDFHVFNASTKSSFFVGKSSLWYGTSLTGNIQIFSIASGCTYDGGGGTSVLSAQANGNVLVGTTEDDGHKLQVNGRIKGAGYHLDNTSAAYCGLMPNSMITTSGNSKDIWLYNDYKVSLYGSEIHFNATTKCNGNLITSLLNGYTPITSGNINSQSVTYATTATNATRLYASDEPYRYGDSSPYYLKMRYNVLGDNSWYLSVYPESPANVSVDRARKLVTSRGIFGNSFDGTADIPVTAVGHMRYLLFKDAAGTTNVGYIGRGGNTNAMELQTYGNYSLYIGAYSKNILTIAPSGNVIVGSTADYSQRLQINGNIRFIADADCEIGNAYSLTDTNAYNRIIIGNGSTGIKYCSGRWTSGNVISHSFCVGLYDTPAVTINNNGYLGVNINNAAYHLDVAGDIRTHSIGIDNEDGAGRGISLYRAPNYVDMYGIHFSVTSKFGTHGSVTGAWATYFTTSDNYYGWIFRNSAVSNVASISGSGNATFNGAITFGSDERYKEKLANVLVSLEDIANAPLFNYRWTDRDDKKVHLGTTAQYWNNTNFRNAVCPTKDKSLWTMSYSEIAMGNTIVIARELLPIKREVSKIEKLESRVSKLERILREHNINFD